mgnify:CR=1 FL=1
MEKQKFTTKTSPKSNLIYCSVMALLFAIVFFVVERIFPQIGMYILLIGALVCISCFGAGIILATSSPVILKFEDDELTIHDSSGKDYSVYAVSAKDFVFMQTPLERKYNMGCLRIKGTIFWMFGVINLSETKTYVNNNFPDW